MPDGENVVALPGSFDGMRFIPSQRVAELDDDVIIVTTNHSLFPVRTIKSVFKLFLAGVDLVEILLFNMKYEVLTHGNSGSLAQIV